ncbi:ATP-binding cassette domain-containing protein [Enemella sp. A6]|uniref:ATP-binding cassette domain-containing protein n=1 Tax=Enemella sp. A6 TaxID=3440152 RepID=UPI003EB87432
MHSSWRRERTFWAGMWAASPVLTATGWLLVLFSGVSTYLTMWGTAELVGALATGGTADRVHQLLALTVAALVVQPVAVNLLIALAAAHQRQVSADQHRRIALLANAPHGIAHLEDPAESGRLTALLDDLRGHFGLFCIPEVWRSLYVRTTGVAAVVLLARWSWVPVVALIAVQVLFGRVFTGYISTIQRDLLDNASIDGRRTQYLHHLLTERAAGKEVRLFGLTEHLAGRHATIWLTAQAGMQARRNRALRPALAAGLLVLLVTGAAIGLLVRQAWLGGVSTAVLLAALQAMAGMRSFGPLGDTSAQAARARVYAVRLAELESASAASVPVASDLPDDVVGRAAGIRLDDVSFTYPGRGTPVFRGLSLTVPAGQSVAVVGVNGVGKSTLIKLLAGLYPPSSGTVRVDDADPFTDDVTRRRVAVIFQDFVRYHLSLRENVLLGVDGGTDEQAHSALRSAAATDVLHRVGSLDVPLDPGYAGGTDLSGGQWQRIALARAFAAVEAGAGVLVLDEPTAALDVRVEAEIFEHFLATTRGMTTILVSHRLSSMRHAERIVVLGPHGVVEDGPHEQLLAAGGEYAQMFTLQASRFRHEEAAR